MISMSASGYVASAMTVIWVGLAILLIALRIWGNDAFLWMLPAKTQALIKQRRQDELAALTGYHRRLKTITDTLLSKVDELDRQSDYVRSLPTHWSKLLTNSCSQSVVLVDKVERIGGYLRKRHTRVARQQLLASLKMASGLAQDLSTLRLDSKSSTESNPSKEDDNARP